jgi:hypothetical protein
MSNGIHTIAVVVLLTFFLFRVITDGAKENRPGMLVFTIHKSIFFI